MAVRTADDILVGGGRVFIVDGTKKNELGWLSGEIKFEEQANTNAVKESEGGTVLYITTDKEVHLTFSLLEANLDTFKLLNPAYHAIGGTGDTTADGEGYAAGTYQGDTTYQIEFWHKKRSGDYRCLRIYKGKIAGNFTPLLINQDTENPISVDVVGIADSTKDTDRNIYELFDVAKSAVSTKVPNGGW